MVTGTNLYIVQLPDYFLLLIIMVTLKVSSFTCRTFQSLVANCRISAFIKKSYLDNWTCLFYPVCEIILVICMNKISLSTVLSLCEQGQSFGQVLSK